MLQMHADLRIPLGLLKLSTPPNPPPQRSDLSLVRKVASTSDSRE